MSGLDRDFQDYFKALDRTGGEDRCFLCRRTPSEVKAFFGFGEDGLPLEAKRHGLEDVTLSSADIMSYRGARPVCAVCQLNLDATCALGDQGSYLELLRQMEENRESLWPPAGARHEESDAGPGAEADESPSEPDPRGQRAPGETDAEWGDGV